MEIRNPTLEETITLCKRYYESRIDVHKRANIHSSVVDEYIAHCENLEKILNMIKNN